MAIARAAFLGAAASLLVSRSTAQVQFGPQGLSNLCGTFGDQDTCRQGDVSSFKTQVVFEGITSGPFAMNQNVFTDTACATQSLDIDAAGTWQDLGPAYPTNPAGGVFTNNTRKIFVNMSFWMVTAKDAATVAALNDASSGCPCGGTWVLNQARQLTTCTRATTGIQGTCPDTSGLFGGSVGQVKQGTGIGVPMFGLALAQYSGTTAMGLTLGRWDLTPDDGFTNYLAEGTDQPPQFTSTGAGTKDIPCAAPSTLDNYCGRWNQPCSPKLDTYDPSDGTMQSFEATFEYCGAAGDPTLGSLSSYGWFVKNYTLFDDEICSPAVQRLSYTEEGTFGSGAVTMTGELSNQFEKYAGSITVTPWTANAAINLQNNCPCGSDGQATWNAGTPRRLTTCMGTCNAGPWYQNATIGQPQYGTVRRLQNQEELDQVQFSAPVMQQADAQNQLLESSELAFTVDESVGCPFDNPQTDVCGTWQQDCVTGGFANSDQSTELMLTGQGEMDGEAVMYKVFYTADQGCSMDPSQKNEELIVEATGFYSRQLVQETHEGILFNFATLFVTATDTGSMVDALNDATYGCPCGGTWVAGQRRQLSGGALGKTCPSGTCPAGQSIFGGGTLGQPGYGIFSRADDKLQLSLLKSDEASGIYPGGKMDATSFPFDLGAPCAAPQPSEQLCGQWQMPCQADPVDDFTAAFSYDISNGFPGTYSLNRSDFTTGKGCDDDPILMMTQAGTITQTGQETTVVNSVAVELAPTAMTITSFDDGITSRLNQVCPCGATWTTKAPRTFTSATPCPAGSCTDTSWVRQPLGVSSYGSIRRMGESLRMTMFNETPAVGYQNDLLPFDYAFTLITEQPQCGANPNPGPVPPPPPPPPPGPPPPSPGPNPPPSPPVPKVWSCAKNHKSCVNVGAGNGGKYVTEGQCDAACGVAPQTGGKKKKGKMGGGDIMILLFFLFSAVYLIGGMTINYMQSGGSNGGTPTIPHVEFWRAVPGLVAEGINFTFCQLCGTKAGGNYARFGGMENTYGSL